jgi:hypothetical protein
MDSNEIWLDRRGGDYRSIAMRKLCYFVSAAAIATGVAAFAVPASAQPFSGVMSR